MSVNSSKSLRSLWRDLMFPFPCQQISIPSSARSRMRPLSRGSQAESTYAVFLGSPIPPGSRIAPSMHAFARWLHNELHSKIVFFTSFLLPASTRCCCCPIPFHCFFGSPVAPSHHAGVRTLNFLPCFRKRQIPHVVECFLNPRKATPCCCGKGKKPNRIREISVEIRRVLLQTTWFVPQHHETEPE